MADIVDRVRTRRTARIPVGFEHEVVDQQLSTPFEEIGEPDRPAGSGQGVTLGDLHHRQLSSLRIERVAHTA